MGKLKAIVIGNPVSHSLSPRVHGWWLKHYGIEGEYGAVKLEKSELEGFVRGLPEAGYAGVNVTIPYKEDVLPFLDFVDESVELVGACNTIIVREGKLIGINTDVYGFITYLKEQTQGRDFREKKAVVLGAGGAARAICAGVLGELGVHQLAIVNRTAEKAGAIKTHFSKVLREVLTRKGENTDAEIAESVDYFVSELRIVGWDKAAEELEDAALLVNTSALGMVGQPPLELDLSGMPRDGVVADIVFNPLETGLLKAAKAEKLVAVDGLGMLLHQAAPGFKSWFDQENTAFSGLPEVTAEQRAYVLEGLK